MDSFWRLPVRMLQPNLRMRDARGLEGRRLVRECRAYGANAILANGGGIVAWYPTSLSFQWRNPYLDHDFVGAVTDETRRLGMRALLRMDWSCLIPSIVEQHRDWLAWGPDRRPILEWGASRNPLYRLCPNRAYWQEYGPRELEEMLERYAVAGFFFNAWDLPLCYCPECQQACREALGEKIPVKLNWASSFGRAFLVWRNQRHARFTRELKERIQRFSPETLLTVDYHLTNDHPHHLGRAGWDGALLTEAVDMVTVEAFNFLDRPHPQWRYWAAEEAQMIRSFPPGKPGIVLLTGSERWLGRRPAQPPEQLTENIRQIVAHGVHVCVAISGDFRQEDRKALPAIKKAFRSLEAGLEVRAANRPARTILVYSQRTMDLYGGDQARERALFHYRGWYEALTESHVNFSVVHDGALEQVLEKRARLEVLILPNCACLSRTACRAVETWVRQGGVLIATFETSRFTEAGELRSGFGLRCLPRRPRETVTFPGSWFEINPAGRGWVGRHTDIVPVSGEFLLTRGPQRGALRLLRWTFNNKPEWSEPETATNQFGIYETRWGKGRVYYLPWTPGKLYHLCRSPEHRELMRRLGTRG
jgi:hypothetical protein